MSPNRWFALLLRNFRKPLAGRNYIGVEPPASIARRNMRIFANLLAIAEPGDRILIIYGNGHTHYFREYVRGHPQMELAHPREYL